MVAVNILLSVSVLNIILFYTGGTSGFPGVEKDETESGLSEALHQQILDSGVTMGQIDLEDLPISGLSGDQALDIMFQRYKARMMHQHGARMFESEDLSEKEIGEICGNSASLECGKKVLKHVNAAPSDSENNGKDDPSTSNVMTVHWRCNLRKEFLDCIDAQRKSCRRQADKDIYPRLPPKSIIRSTQSKIWRALWTSGGCVLIN